MSLPVPSEQTHLTHPKYRADIDGLRAIAVLSVVGFHAFPGWIQGGFIGVDIFFVISGFLISSIIFSSLDKGTFSFTEFYTRRIKRIFPALLIVLVACYAFGWFVLFADEYKQLGKHVFGGAAFIDNFLLWRESGYFDNAAETKPLLHLWTLGIEEQFYIVWPLVLWFAWKQRLNLLTISIVVAFISFALNIRNVHGDVVAAFYSPQTRFWELMAGSVLAYILLYRQNLIDTWLSKIFYGNANPATLHNIQSAAGVTLIASGLLIIKNEYLFPGWWAVLPVSGAALIISAGAHAWFNRKILSSKVLVWFGLISFPLYLWHWPLLSFSRLFENGIPERESRFAVHIAMILIAITLAWLTYVFVEKPVRFGSLSKVKLLMLTSLMLTIGGIGYLTYAYDGLKFRFSSPSKLLVQPADFNIPGWLKYVREGKCHLQNYDSLTHDASCHETKRPLIALWGDSHAAALYPGLIKIQSTANFGVVQLTAAACGPIFNMDKLIRKNCNEVNKLNMRELLLDKPDILILHAAWRLDTYPLTDEELKIKFTKTIQEIKANLPKTKIIIIGPVPRWIDSPQKTALSFLRKQALYGQVSESIPITQPANQLKDVEAILLNISKKEDVKFISALSELCNEKGCISRIGNEPEDFIAIDYGHFSKSGSEYFINKIRNQIFK